MRRVVFVFLDGVGVGEPDPASNPFVVAQLPNLERLLDGARPFLDTVPIHAAHATALALEATLGMAGTPQSGTGQTALFTGRNAAELFGRHFGPWVPTELRALLAAHSVLARVAAAGHSVAFANAYPEEALAQLEVPDGAPPARRPYFLRAGPPLAALGVNALVRHTAALARGDAVASEITNDGWRRILGRTTLPDVTAREAGRNLARIAADHTLTLFAHYSTDASGHDRDMVAAIAALERVDAFLGGLYDALGDALLVVTSDHGNLEDVRTGHTRNPALCLVAGAGHAAFAAPLRSITDVAPALVDVVG